jgi:predicted Ser/Thr protein kinase
VADGATPAPPKGGPRAFGKYSILRELGRGGMGVVYEAVDTQLNRKVALKLLIVRPSTDPARADQERQRFSREAQMAAKLKHPGVVTLFEAGEIQGKRYLAMEVIDGQPLQAWLRKKPLRDQVAVLRDVAIAVHHAHEQGVLHRDLKPANVPVRKDGSPCVMDFGLAKVMGADTGLSVTSDGMCVGTPAYMSPEQARGAKTVDGRTDVYSMGVILYEMLSGRQPFEGETAIEILMKASKERAPKPSTVSQGAVDPAFDGTIESISLKALEKEARDRYASAQAFADDLTRWLKGESVHVTTVHRTRRKLAPAKRATPWLWPAVAGGVVVLMLGAWLLTRPSGPPPVDVELSRARQLSKEGRHAEARIEYARALAKDPGNAEAAAGDAQAAQAQKRAEDERQRKHREELAAARETKDKAAAESERARQEAEAKLKSAASEAEQKRLQQELEAIKARARQAEEDARLAREELQKAEARKDAPPPAVPAPAPAPPPPPAPRPPPPPAAPPPLRPRPCPPRRRPSPLPGRLRRPP